MINESVRVKRNTEILNQNHKIFILNIFSLLNLSYSTIENYRFREIANYLEIVIKKGETLSRNIKKKIKILANKKHTKEFLSIS